MLVNKIINSNNVSLIKKKKKIAIMSLSKKNCNNVLGNIS